MIPLGKRKIQKKGKSMMVTIPKVWSEIVNVSRGDMLEAFITIEDDLLYRAERSERRISPGESRTRQGENGKPGR